MDPEIDVTAARTLRNPEGSPAETSDNARRTITRPSNLNALVFSTRHLSRFEPEISTVILSGSRSCKLGLGKLGSWYVARWFEN
jgi:hypothetical protein